MTPTNLSPAGQTSNRSGFTLIEMMVVIMIISLAFGCFLALLGGSSNFTAGGYNILGVFQQAQSVAVTRSTYVWVGLFEEDPTHPGTSGTGQLVISVVASVDGTNLMSDAAGSTTLPAGSLSQVLPLIKIPNVHADIALTNNDISSLPAIAATQIDPTIAGGAYNFLYPILPAKAPVNYSFTQIIQFDPQGDVSAIYGNPVQLMQLGLMPAVGNTKLTNSKNVLAIQLSGIGGKATIYRP